MTGLGRRTGLNSKCSTNQPQAVLKSGFNVHCTVFVQGRVTTTGLTLDYETQADHFFTVQAVDNRIPQRTSYAMVSTTPPYRYIIESRLTGSL